MSTLEAIPEETESIMRESYVSDAILVERYEIERILERETRSAYWFGFVDGNLLGLCAGIALTLLITKRPFKG